MNDGRQTVRKAIFNKCLLKTIDEYLGVSSISGLKYVQKGQAPAIKICWGVIIILSFIFCNILVGHFWLRYKSNSTRMIIASNHLPLPTLKLPAITLCSTSQININRLDSFVNTLKASNQEANAYSSDDLRRMLQQSIGFFATTIYNQAELQILENIMNKTSYSVSDVMAEMQTTCDDMLLKCRFEGKNINCSDIFKPMTSQYGLCCIFNKNNTQTVTKVVIGKISLSILIRPNNVTDVGSEVIQLLVYETNTSASTSTFDSTLSSESETLLEFAPELKMCSREFSEKSISERKCLFEHERRLRYFADYRQLNCKLECTLAFLERTCQCLPYFYSMYSRTARICTFTDIKCLVDKYWSTQNRVQNLTCNCMPNCVDIQYQATLTQTKLHKTNFTVARLYQELDSKHMVIHVSFGKQVYRAISKVPTTNMLALTANLGGIYSLFIGFSAITFFEIIYYFCVRFYLNYQNVMRTTTAAERLTKKHPAVLAVKQFKQIQRQT